MSTPHNEAAENEIAKVVLMPGDPLRAKFIADTFLENYKQFNTVRNMFGYTGYYKGQQVSVMGSGMGMPSIGIYSYELFHDYDVDVIIRIGSAGAYSSELNLYDLVLAENAWSESSYAYAQANVKKDRMYPDKHLNETIMNTANKLNTTVKIAPIHSSDVFYHEEGICNPKEIYERYGCVCVEMESYALFHNANILNKKAACLLTISDSLVKQEFTTAKERETSFTKMMQVALETAITL